jgi:peptidoglycan/xylan/chitin deacetylase (PgdA/CDA1 family)
VSSSTSAPLRPTRGSLTLHLTFHGVGDPPRPLESGEAEYWCSISEMEAILDCVTERGDVRISSDDGNRSDLEVLAPALARRGLTGTFFVLAGRLSTAGFLSEVDLRELLRMGMTIGSHGWDHVPWRRLKDDVARRELTQARRRLEDAVGVPIREAALPFGAYDRMALRKLCAEGFERVYSSDGGWARERDWLVARNSVGACRGANEIRTLLGRPGIGLLASLKRKVKRWR